VAGAGDTGRTGAGAGESGMEGGAYPVGHDFPPDREIVRFRAHPSLSFPASPIAQLDQPSPRGPDREASIPPEMVVTFLGLTGPAGVLPQHYTELLLHRLRAKDPSLRDFLDLFNHRLVSLFFRAWEKYRLPFAYERAHADEGPEPDLVTQGLYGLVGLGTGGLRGRLDVDDEAFLHYAGHFAHAPRSASALEALLEDHFEVPVRVEQFQGQWLYLDPDDHALLPGPGLPRGRNNVVASNLVIGDRVWDAQSKFRLRLGPLDYQRFRSLMPNGDALQPLAQMTRTYVGPGFDFDVQPVLKPEAVPCCCLIPDEGGDGPFLSWNTWIRGEPFTREADDTVFHVERF
jgi:type VI secretion system protein ImpH